MHSKQTNLPNNFETLSNKLDYLIKACEQLALDGYKAQQLNYERYNGIDRRMEAVSKELKSGDFHPAGRNKNALRLTIPLEDINHSQIINHLQNLNLLYQLDQ